MFALLCLTHTTGRSIGMLTNAAEEQAATSLVNGTMKPNRDARPILNAVTQQLVTTLAAEVGAHLGFYCVTVGVQLVDHSEKKFSVIRHKKD